MSVQSFIRIGSDQSIYCFIFSDERGIYEPTGPELVAFIKDTLNKNMRDRMALLKIERELHALVNDTG